MRKPKNRKRARLTMDRTGPIRISVMQANTDRIASAGVIRALGCNLEPWQAGEPHKQHAELLPTSTPQFLVILALLP